jgi:hypothetical protein
MKTSTYHPDHEINEEVKREALAGEIFDLGSGMSPKRWRCECGAEHGRGHFGNIGAHRCLSCGYVGDGGVML